MSDFPNIFGKNAKYSLLLQILLKVLGNLTEKMHTCIATANVVVAVGIGELTEILVSLHQSFGIFGYITIMNIVVSSTLADKQMAM